MDDTTTACFDSLMGKWDAFIINNDGHRDISEQVQALLPLALQTALWDSDPRTSETEASERLAACRVV